MARYRVGRKVPYTIYLQTEDVPSDEDIFVASARTADMAAELVAAANVDPLLEVADWIPVGRLEQIAAEVHEAWRTLKLVRGITSRLSETGEELMQPYAELSEDAKNFDREIVRVVAIAMVREAGKQRHGNDHT